MITNRKVNIATDPRGKIKTGIKAISKTSGKEYPQGTDYFVIDKFPELVAAYGEKPSNLLVIPPADTIEAVFDDTYTLWGGGGGEKQGTKIRTCNSDRCTHRIAEVVPYLNEDGTKASVSFKEGETGDCTCKELGLFATQDKEIRKKACKYALYAKFFVANPKTGKVESPLPFLFESHSLNSGAAVHGALENMAATTARYSGGIPLLYGLPFELSVKMVEGKTDAKQKFPIWKMAPVGTIDEIVKRLVVLAQVRGRDEDLLKRLISRGETGPSTALIPIEPAAAINEALEDAPASGPEPIDPEDPLGTKKGTLFQ